MSYKPDYGLKLLNDGIRRDVDHYFASFALYSVTVLGTGLYSTMVEVSRDGERCALSLDFNQEQLEKILKKASPEIASFLRQELLLDPSSPRTINFEGEVIFAVRARLGQLQALERRALFPSLHRMWTSDFLDHRGSPWCVACLICDRSAL